QWMQNKNSSGFRRCAGDAADRLPVQRRLVLPAAASENGGHDPSPRSLWTAAGVGLVGVLRRLADGGERAARDEGAHGAGQEVDEQRRSISYRGSAASSASVATPGRV